MSDTLTVQVQSLTDPKRTYTLHAHAGAVTCNCRGYSSWRHCKHQAALERVLEEGPTDMTDETKSEETTALAKRAPDAPPAALIAIPMRQITPVPTGPEFEMYRLIASTVVLAKGMVPAGITTEAQAMAVILAGREVGLKPMTALRHVYIINGKTDVETRAMVGIVRANAPEIRFEWPEYTDVAVTCVFTRPGQAPIRVQYTKAMAEASGQYGKNPAWRSFTRDMLYAAATKRACRMGAPDLINAIDAGMQSVEAVGAAMEGAPPPDISVRVLEKAELEATAIPETAYNEGDAPGPLPVEVAPPAAEQSLRKAIRDVLTEIKAADPKYLAETVLPELRQAYPHIFNAEAQLILRQIASAAEEEAIALYLGRALASLRDDQGPPADDDDAPIGEPVAAEAVASS